MGNEFQTWWVRGNLRRLVPRFGLPASREPIHALARTCLLTPIFKTWLLLLAYPRRKRNQHDQKATTSESSLSSPSAHSPQHNDGHCNGTNIERSPPTETRLNHKCPKLRLRHPFLEITLAFDLSSCSISAGQATLTAGTELTKCDIYNSLAPGVAMFFEQPLSQDYGSTVMAMTKVPAC